METQEHDLDSTPFLLIFQDILAKGECGILCHDRDLDHFQTGVLKKYSANADMTFPVLARIVAVCLARYPEKTALNPRAHHERTVLRKIYKLLKEIE